MAHRSDHRHRARLFDAADPLSELRQEFSIPRGDDGSTLTYLAGNSLGLQPVRAQAAVDEAMSSWAERGVKGHFEGDSPWYRYEETGSALQARLVGGAPEEVGLMGTLTQNLHLLMASFYRPQGARRKILVEPHAFPSDRYAVASQVSWHGGNPTDDVVVVEAADPPCLTLGDVEAAIGAHKGEIAMALIGGVNYYTGQCLELGPLAALLHRHEIVVGYDLAHAAGNVELSLHDWDVDFAAWCTYKYLNGGPGSTAGYFVHARHGTDLDTPRLAGWWGNDPETRFDMARQERFVPRSGAGGWQVSNPSILAMAPVRASLEMFDRVGMGALRQRSMELTGFLEGLLGELVGVTVITPSEPDQRGAQLSVRVAGDASELERRLDERGVIADVRDPDVIRMSPTPMYNTFEDCVDAAEALAAVLGPERPGHRERRIPDSGTERERHRE